MKATITEVPQPKPPRVVTLEMTEEEARKFRLRLGGLPTLSPYETDPVYIAYYALGSVV